jgi:hypothetical protein
MLGKIIMKVRDELRLELRNESRSVRSCWEVKIGY